MILKVEGAARLRRTLKDAGADMKDLKAANKRAAQTVMNAAKALSPVGPDAGGHIKSTGRVGATTRAGIVRFGNKAKPYGGPIHWGWPARGIDPQPWITTAAQTTESTWVDMYYRDLEKVLDQIKGK